MTAKWLERFGGCVNCGKRADGILRDERNGELGRYCIKCAQHKIAYDAKIAAEYQGFLRR